MSWERFEHDVWARCACGKGKVIRHLYSKYDDWNRSEHGCISEEIQCDNCKKKFHIEHLIRRYWCPSWVSDGISDRIFLVPNGLKIPPIMSEKTFYFSNIDEEIVSKFAFDEIESVIIDMKEKKFSTKLTKEESKGILKIYYKRTKRKSLPPIISSLEQIIQNYEIYDWTPDKINEYRVSEKSAIDNNEKAIKKIIKESYELNFNKEA